MYAVNTASCIFMEGLRRMITDMVLAVGDGDIHQLGIFWLFRSSEDKRGIGCSILGFVFANGCKVARVADDCGARCLQLFQ